ncbi:RPB9 DNA-directed RNA polymerase subunit M Transcription elongation factor TFIIS [Pyrenophora tritici-repentis]|uniref:DNA-directed RNA polymerase protein n=1 Tax=Pyrenophora tritici-repentis TaxID=45151 RepID=A0A922NA28_9PLEO|nr:DNA-directed RNA polymerase protein [Pyrenophora tritici-repentis]KAI1576643.1 RPB9 DNA-directed RNA polymerase subunit M Transcription elongation factor TFIIS [Pyrenophora tritici-repentis]
MSSPLPQAPRAKGGKEPILFRFCSECSNLLFPREDKSENKLLFACRTCSFTEEAPSSCVMRHEIASTVGATAGVTAEVAQDPTVGLSLSEAQAAQAALDEEMPCCTMCGMPIICEDCGEESAPGFVLEAEDEDPQAERPQQEMREEEEKLEEEKFEDYDEEDFDEDMWDEPMS